jgi:hypothetical protein
VLLTDAQWELVGPLLPEFKQQKDSGNARLPRLSRRCFGWGSKGSISFHCSSVNSFCRFFITEVLQLTRLKRK